VTREEFDNEEWLTPLEVAQKFRYSTAEPILKAIKSGRLDAHDSPCGRRVLVRVSDYERYRDSLRLRRTSPSPAADRVSSPRRPTTRRRSQMPIPH
jgi:hypothetical protein